MTKILDKGLYLFVPQPTYDNIYDYTFKYSLVSVPTSKYITATKVDENGNIVSDDSASDDWEYNVDIILKPEATPRYGSLKIIKTLETFNESLGKASFVFEVEATREDKIVFSNVYSMYFDSAKTKSVSVEHIPAGSTVTVKEVYSGASYTLESNSVITKEIVANNTVEANFTNDYDNRLIEGGIGIENHFIKSNEDGVDFEWDGSNIAATNDIQESEDE